MQFDHEKLIVYQVSIEFVAWVGTLLDGPLADVRLSAVGQLDRASTSVPLNLAEGNAKRSSRDRCRYLDTARGSAFESAAALDVLVARGALTAEAVRPGKDLLRRVAEMLSKLTQTFGGALDEEPGQVNAKRGGGSRPAWRDQ
jgi:four helix bundle protein